MKKKKTYLYICVVIIIFLVAAIFIFNNLFMHKPAAIKDQGMINEATYDNPPSRTMKGYSSRHGFSIKYPDNYFIENNDMEQMELPENGNLTFQIYNYDIDRVRGSEYFPPNMFKIEVSISKRTYGSYKEWTDALIKVGQIKSIVSEKDLQLKAGTAKDIDYIYSSEMLDSDTQVDEVFFLTDKLQITFIYFPDNSNYKEAIYNIYRSFDIKR